MFEYIYVLFAKLSSISQVFIHVWMMKAPYGCIYMITIKDIVTITLYTTFVMTI